MEADTGDKQPTANGVGPSERPGRRMEDLHEAMTSLRTQFDSFSVTMDTWFETLRADLRYIRDQQDAISAKQDTIMAFLQSHFPPPES